MCNYLVDKETQESVKHSSKTYHQNCFQQFELGKQHRRELHEYICELYNMPVVSGFILKQIKDYEEIYGYKLTGIKAALHWFHFIDGNSVEAANKKYKAQGIGIVPHIYEKAKSYYQWLGQTYENNSLVNYSFEEKVIKTSSPKKREIKNIDIENIL